MFVLLGLLLLLGLVVGLSFFFIRKDHPPSDGVIEHGPGLKKGIKEWGQ